LQFQLLLLIPLVMGLSFLKSSLFLFKVFMV
jgi:hypothetical protein